VPPQPFRQVSVDRDGGRSGHGLRDVRREGEPRPPG
jgi:hypothetical protein